MTATATYVKKVYIGTSTSGTFEEIPANSASLNIGTDLFDDTNFANNAGYRTRVYTLADTSASIEGFWVESGAAQVILRNAQINRTTVFFKYLPTGVAGEGLKIEMLVESFNQSGDVGGVEGLSVSLQGTAVPTADNV